MILGLFLIAYYFTNFAIAEWTGDVTYSYLGLDWKDYAESFIIVVIHFVFTMFIYYILYLVSQCRHHRIAKRVSKRRLTMKADKAAQDPLS